MASDTENDGRSRSSSPDESADQEAGEMIGSQDIKDENGEQAKDGSAQKKTAANAKDPSRPRRKKARRACYACQRAHLTCGDERPCQRCIKRGLQDACQDGVRKKAKYLHDAPNEALMPGASTQFQYMTNLQRAQQNPRSPPYAVNPIGDLYTPRQRSYQVYPNTTTSGSIPMSDGLISGPAYGPQQSPVSSQFQGSPGRPPSSMQSLVQVMESTAPPPDPNAMQNFSGGLFDANDLTQYNFDPASFNFGNHYGALEFGMLGQLSSGAAETPPSDTTSSLTQPSGGNFTGAGASSANYNESPVASTPFLYNQDSRLTDWRPPTQPQSNVRQTRPVGNYGANGAIKQETPSAFSIAAGSAFASPISETSPQSRPPFDDNINSKNVFTGGSASTPSSRPSTQGLSNTHPQPQSQPQLQTQTSQQGAPKFSTANLFAATRSRGDPSTIYDNVTQPYSYTTGFHSLIAFLKRRFSPQKTLRIAKALASIRPSFISCTRTLGEEDLVFMEQSFQRALWEYENYINVTGTPTIVCRRTGEVAAVGSEFTILTGWKKDVLLGKEANLNVNTGGGGSASGTGPPSTGASSRGGVNTPRVPGGALNPSRPQPVFLAELLDDDSVVDFYEDFARLAFGDSRGGVMRRCKLLKYRSKENEGLGAAAELSDAADRPLKRRRTKGKGDSFAEATITDLGGKDGKVDCSCCWTVKRDLFDLPMMIVMNVSKSLPLNNISSSGSASMC